MTLFFVISFTHGMHNSWSIPIKRQEGGRPDTFLSSRPGPISMGRRVFGAGLAIWKTDVAEPLRSYKGPCPKHSMGVPYMPPH